jgi:hypothetical protein
MSEKRICPHRAGEYVCLRGKVPPDCSDCSVSFTGLTMTELVESSGKARQESLGELAWVMESPLKGPEF